MRYDILIQLCFPIHYDDFLFCDNGCFMFLCYPQVRVRLPPQCQLFSGSLLDNKILDSWWLLLNNTKLTHLITNKLVRTFLLSQF